MKTIALICVLVPFLLRAGTNSIITLDGKVYLSAKVTKQEPDSITVEYSPTNGAIGIARVKFDKLTNEDRQKYGYDPVKEAAYKAQKELDAAEARKRAIAVADIQARYWLEKSRIEAELEKQLLDQAQVEAAQRIADAIEQQNLATRRLLFDESMEYRRIARGIDDLNWTLSEWRGWRF